MQEFKVRFSMDYTQPILSLGISPDRSTIGVGMADGLLTVRSRALNDAVPDAKASRAPRAGSFHYFLVRHLCARGPCLVTTAQLLAARLAAHL